MRYYDGVANLEEEKTKHREAFYNLLDESRKTKDYSTSLLMEDRWSKILEVCTKNKTASSEEFRTLQQEEGYSQAFKWRLKFDVIIFGDSNNLVYKEPPTPDASLLLLLASPLPLFPPLLPSLEPLLPLFRELG